MRLCITGLEQLSCMLWGRCPKPSLWNIIMSLQAEKSMRSDAWPRASTNEVAVCCSSMVELDLAHSSEASKMGSARYKTAPGLSLLGPSAIQRWMLLKTVSVISRYTAHASGSQPLLEIRPP